MMKRRRRPVSEYGKQLAEKQKVRYLYGVSERVLRNYVKAAVLVRSVPAEEALVEMLERRLDSVVYQIGFASTRRMARQMVSHGHFTVNGRKVTIPSYSVRDSDRVGIRDGSVKTTLFQTLLGGGKSKLRAEWVSWNSKDRQGSIAGKPIPGETVFSLPTVLEYYSR